MPGRTRKTVFTIFVDSCLRSLLLQPLRQTKLEEIDIYIRLQVEKLLKDYKNNHKESGKYILQETSAVDSFLYIPFSLTVGHCSAQAPAGRATVKLLLLLMEHIAHQDT